MIYYIYNWVRYEREPLTQLQQHYFCKGRNGSIKRTLSLRFIDELCIHYMMSVNHNYFNIVEFKKMRMTHE